jgi:hypothetical protein
VAIAIKRITHFSFSIPTPRKNNVLRTPTAAMFHATIETKNPENDGYCIPGVVNSVYKSTQVY